MAKVTNAASVPANTTVKLIVGADNISKEISLIKSQAGKLSDRIKVCALSCIEHIKLHGDNTLLFKLLAAIPKGLRSQSFISYCETFAGVDYVKKGEDGKRLEDGRFKKRENPVDEIKVKQGDKVVTVRKEDVDPLNFNRNTIVSDTPDEYPEYDVLADLDKLIKRATKAEEHVKSNPADAGKVKAEPELLKSLRVLRQTYEDKRNRAKAKKQEEAGKAAAEIVKPEQAAKSSGSQSRRRPVNVEARNAAIAAGNA